MPCLVEIAVHEAQPGKNVMRYLYADSTPFPLPQNFLATICAGTDACVSILRAEELVDDCNRVIREAEAKATRELAQLSALSHRVDGALGAGSIPPVPVPEGEAAASKGAQSPGDVTLGRIRELAWTALDQARNDVLKGRDMLIASAMHTSPRTMVLPALSAFLSAHEVPDTAWGIRWTAGLGGATTRAELHARTPVGLEAVFDVAIPTGHVWARAASIAMLGADASIAMVRKPMLGKARPMLIRLGAMYVTHVVLTPDRATLKISKSGKNPSEGIEFVFGSGDGPAEVMATRVDKAGYPLQEAERLSLTDATAVHKLWSRVTTLLGGLVAYRTRATSARLGGVPVVEVGRPLVVAQTILRALAPYVREIAARTTVPRELALKRELGDGCREELFIHYETVLERIKQLSKQHQALFEIFGLQEEQRPSQPPQQAIAAMYRLPVVRPPALRAS